MANMKSYEQYVTGILTSIKKPAVLIPTIGVLELTKPTYREGYHF